MGKRPARCYTKLTGPAYTRTQGRKNKGYIRGIPGSKLVMYDMGNKGYDFEVELHLVGLEAAHVRHMALEAARQAINRHCVRTFGIANFHFTVRVHPHHVLRENKMMAFAGADRMQDGMRHSFGKPADYAARVSANQELLTLRVDAKNFEKAKFILKKGIAKLPVPGKIVVGKGAELVK